MDRQFFFREDKEELKKKLIINILFFRKFKSFIYLSSMLFFILYILVLVYF